MRQASWLVLFLLVSVLTSTQLWAAPKTALEIIEKVDEVTFGYKDQVMKVRMTIMDKDDDKGKSYDMVMSQLGKDKRLVRFTSGENKGMAVLSRGEGQMYVYLPAFKKVRHVASHSNQETFAGSDFTSADMAATSYAKGFNCSLDKDNEKYWFLSCTPKDGNGNGYSKLGLMVDKQGYRIWKTDYYIEGKLVKSMLARDLHTFPGGASTPRDIMMTDARTGHKTRLYVLDLKVDTGLKEKDFTKRKLQWGR